MVESLLLMKSRVVLTPPLVVTPTLLISTVPPAVAAGLFNFAIPFENTLWALIICTMVLHGLCWWICRPQLKPPVASQVEEPYGGNGPLTNTGDIALPEPALDKGTEGGVGYYSERTLVFNVFYSLNTLSGEKASVEDNTALKILTMAYNFMLLIIVSAYTANLATVLLSMAIPPPAAAGQHWCGQ